ncbi:MAG: YfiR/HmsC family protein [Thiotrichales bacterium]
MKPQNNNHGTQLLCSQPTHLFQACNRWLCSVIGFVAPLLLGSANGVIAASEYGYDEAEIKAAYLVNFTHFTRWVERESKPVLNICVAGDLGVYQALKKLEPDAEAKRPLIAELVELPGKVSHCDLLYVADIDAAKKPVILKALAEKSVITVSDMPNFITDGGMISLQKRHARLVFELNLTLARQSGIKFESRLARLAGNATRYAAESLRVRPE